MISKNNSSESHNFGLNCMECHIQGGGGEGWFTVAGSLYNNTQASPYPNGLIRITTEANGKGTVILEVEIDNKGNFYTTETIDYVNGIYVGIYGTSGEQKFMNSKITKGACNSCHDNGNNKIWLK